MTINVSEILNRVPTKEELAELHEQYPFWINPDVSMLKGGPVQTKHYRKNSANALARLLATATRL